MMMKHPRITTLLVISFFTFATAQALGGGSVLTFKSNARLKPSINPAFQSTMQCLVNKFEAAGIKITSTRSYSTGCYGSRSFTRSLHFRGLACDVMQRDRDVTLLTNSMNKQAINQLAASCNVVSGGIWPGPPRPPSHGSDVGHFQIRSASRASQSQAVHHRTRKHKFRA